MKEYLVTVAAVALMISLAGILLPGGKTAKLASSALSIVFIYVLIRPLVSIGAEDLCFFPVRDFSADEGITSFIEGSIADETEKRIFDVLRQNNLIAEKVFVEIKGTEIGKIEITLSNPVIDENFPHINNSVIGKYIADLLGVDPGIVTVYG